MASLILNKYSFVLACNIMFFKKGITDTRRDQVLFIQSPYVSYQELEMMQKEVNILDLWPPYLTSSINETLDNAVRASTIH